MTVPELINLTETTTAVVHGVVLMADIVGFFSRSFSELSAVLEAQGVTPSGPAFARYAGPPEQVADIEVGFPVHGTALPTGGVHTSSLPAGPVVRLVHAGGYDGLGEAWGPLGAWISEQGLLPGPDLREVPVTEP